MVGPGQEHSGVQEHHCLLALDHAHGLYLALQHVKGGLRFGAPALLAALQDLQAVLAVDAQDLASAAIHCGCAPVAVVPQGFHELALVNVGFNKIALEGPEVSQLLIGAHLLEHISDVCLELDLVLEDVEGEEPDSDDQVLSAAHKVLALVFIGGRVLLDDHQRGHCLGVEF